MKDEEIHDNLSYFHNIMSQNYLENNLNIIKTFKQQTSFDL